MALVLARPFALSACCANFRVSSFEGGGVAERQCSATSSDISQPGLRDRKSRNDLLPNCTHVLTDPNGVDDLQAGRDGGIIVEEARGVVLRMRG